MFTTIDMLADQPFLAGLTEHQLSLLAPLTGRSMFHAACSAAGQRGGRGRFRTCDPSLVRSIDVRPGSSGAVR
jgi:hypothetical protein